MEHIYTEGEELIAANLQALNSTERSIDNMEDNFKLAEVLVDELDQSERSNFERQLVGLRIKQSALEEDFSEKAFEKQTLTEDIVSCNATLEEYINKLKDKEQELTATKKITQEDKELNTNYQKQCKK